MADNAKAKSQWPGVNPVSVQDLRECLIAGWRDFRQAKAYSLFFGTIYTLGGWLLILLLFRLELPYLVYPLAIGFALIAPFVASGLYIISHQLEEGRTLAWGPLFRAVGSMVNSDLGWMALVTGFSFFIWIDIAAFLTFSFFGFEAFELKQLLTLIFTTPKGYVFLLTGNAVGALIAFAVFSFSVVSFPLLYHRHVDFVTAMVTSAKLVGKSPRTMAVWCAIIAALVAFSLATAFLGLLVVLPVLGHATWHLYRRSIAPQADSR